MAGCGERLWAATLAPCRTGLSHTFLALSEGPPLLMGDLRGLRYRFAWKAAVSTPTDTRANIRCAAPCREE